MDGVRRPCAPSSELLEGDSFRLVFEASPFAILVADNDGRYVEANPMACAMFATARHEIIGKSVYDFVDGKDLRPVRTRWDDFRESKVQTGEFHLRRADGVSRILRYHAIAELGPGLHVSYLEDITDTHLAEGARKSAETERDRIYRISSDIIGVIDGDRRIRRVNPAFEAVLGYRQDEAVGLDLVDLAHPDDAASVRAARGVVDERGTLLSHTARYRHKDGSYRWISWSSNAFEDDRYVVGRDVTAERELAAKRELDQKAARHALEQSEARFRMLADGLPVIVWVGDPAGNTHYFNRCWFEYTGLPELPADSPGIDRWADVTHPDDIARLAPLLRERRARGEGIEVTYRLKARDGTYRWHLARSTPIRDAEGRVVYRLGSATDIEDQRRAIDGLEVERDLRERFVAALSHDLRSPLSSAKMSGELILRRPLDPEICRDQAARITRNIDRADRLIQNLLDASRVTAGQPLAIQRAPCDVAALVRDVVADQTAVYGARFELVCDAVVNGLCDDGAVRRTLENLLGNAIKYGSPHAPVRITVREGRGEICLAVQNEGNPIAKEDLSRIFQPYQRAGAGAGAAGPRGWGLGLTLVRGMAEAHGGAVRVESSAEAGTTFTVTLQARRS